VHNLLSVGGHGTMRLILRLSGENIALARAEAMAGIEALGDRSARGRLRGNCLHVETSTDPLKLAERIALCHKISTELAIGSRKEIGERLERIQLSGGSFRMTTLGFEEPSEALRVQRELGRILARRYEVDLDSPDEVFEIHAGRRLRLARVVATINRSSFEKRKGSCRPFEKPISLHPKFCRALVNLSRLPPGGTLLDPFCGTGGILIEAGLANGRPLGSDISGEMISGCALNLAHFGIEAKLEVCDVSETLERFGKVDAIATDPPYGRSSSTRGEGLEVLYRRFLSIAAELLPQGHFLATVVPMQFKGRFKHPDFQLHSHHPLRVHRSLTRVFLVLRRR